jgi:microcin C transport system substrate-binding protein
MRTLPASWPRLLSATTGCAVLLLGAGCGKKETAEDFPPHDNTAEVQAYYRAHPDFFVFASPEDLPAGLQWHDGSDLPEIGSPRRVRGGTWNGRIQDFPRTLRIVGPDSNNAFRPYLLDDTFPGFANIHPNIPGPHQHYAEVAEKWAIDLENRTVYIRIDPAARWSDGERVTVDDVFFMFWFYQSPYIVAPWYNNYYGIGINYTRLVRYDDLTFSVTMKEARPDLPTRVLGLRPVPAHFLREVGDDFVQRYNWRFMPTTGPYEITASELRRLRTNRNHVTLSRVADWWGDEKRNLRYRFNPGQIRLRVIREVTTAWESFLAGDLEAFGLNLAEYYYDRLPDTHPLVERGLIHKATFYNDIPRPTYGLWINSARPHLDNREIRLGIQYASNWQLVIDQYFRGDYTRMNTTADGYGHMTHPGIRARPFDVNRALAHFAAAGFTERGPDGILRNARGERLSFNVSTGYEALAPVLTILQQEARKAGLDLRIEVLDQSAAWKKVQEKNHDIAFTAFAVSVEAYPRYWETYHSSNAYDQPFLEDGVTPNPQRQPKVQTNNLESIALPELDALITRYDNSSSLEEMRELAFRMEEILHDYASFVPGWVMPFYRVGYWRWVQWPDDFNVRFSRDSQEYYLHWIDEEKRTETLAARRGTATFPPSLRVFDQWKTP